MSCVRVAGNGDMKAENRRCEGRGDNGFDQEGLLSFCLSISGENIHLKVVKRARRQAGGSFAPKT